VTPVALLELAGRIGLILFGSESICVGIWGALITDELPQNRRVRDLLPWSRRDRLWMLFMCVGFGVTMIVSGIKVPSEQFTSTAFGLFAGCSSLFWAASAVGIARYAIVELRLASRLRQLRRGQRPEVVDPSKPKWREW
jgi:hypothetical protein